MDKENQDNTQWPYRWDLLLRYRLIEIIALWEGRLTSNALVNAFGIGRQQASKDINHYISEVARDNLIYDKHLKGYKPTASFKPVLTQGIVDEYLHLLNNRRDLMSHVAFIESHQANTEVVCALNRAIKAEYIRPIIQASREQQRLEIQYVSLTSPEPEYRVISPHTIVYSGYRWHVRAYCEKHKQYRDFVLSRIKSIPEPVLDSENGIKDDIAWNTTIDLIIVPDPRLNTLQQQVIADDYGMFVSHNKVHCLKINTRAALASYYLQFLRIDNNENYREPLQQQLILENRNSINHWLMH